MLIDIIAGARPNFMKIAPIIKNIQQAQKKGFDILPMGSDTPGYIRLDKRILKVPSVEDVVAHRSVGVKSVEGLDVGLQTDGYWASVSFTRVRPSIGKRKRGEEKEDDMEEVEMEEVDARYTGNNYVF